MNVVEIDLRPWTELSTPRGGFVMLFFSTLPSTLFKGPARHQAFWKRKEKKRVKRFGFVNDVIHADSRCSRVGGGGMLSQKKKNFILLLKLVIPLPKKKKKKKKIII